MSRDKNAPLCVEWAETTTAHGFLDFSRARTILGKIIWFLLIFGSFYLMTYQLYRGISDYATHEWKTSIQHKRSEKGDIPMPTIILCNANRLKYSKAKQYNLTLDMIRFLFLNLLFNDYLISDFNVTAEHEFTNWRKMHNFTLEDIFNTLGPSSDIVVGDLDHMDAEKIFTPEYGGCLRLKSNKTALTVGAQGSSTFLKLDTQSWDYLPVLENNFIFEGIVMQIVYDDKIEVGKWTMLYPGTHNTIGIQAVQETISDPDRSLLNPFGLLRSAAPCGRNPSMPLSKSAPYSEVNCKLECLWLITIDICQCVPIIVHEQYRTCNVEEYYKCFAGYCSDTNTSSSYCVNETLETLDAKIQQCQDTCSRPCFNRYLEIQISNAKFPSGMLEKELNSYLRQNGLSEGQTNDSIILEIYFSSLSIKTIELYEAVTFDSLISNSGGVIGLWAGMSFLTIFQALAYLLRYLERLIVRKRADRKDIDEKETENKREENFRLSLVPSQRSWPA